MNTKFYRGAVKLAFYVVLVKFYYIDIYMCVCVYNLVHGKHLLYLK